MEEARWDRIAAVSGLLFVALLMLTVFMVPRPPDPGTPADAFRTFFADNDNAIRISVFVAGLAGIAFLWFLGSLRAYLRRAEPQGGRLSAVAFGAGIAALAAVAPSYGLQATAASTATGGGGAGLVLLLYDLGFALQTLAAFAGAALVGAASISAFRSGALPRWLAGVGALLAVAETVSGADLFLDSTVLGPQGAYGFTVFFLFLAWVVVVSAVMIARLGGGARGPKAS